MYRTLLWAADGSFEAEIALDEALRLLEGGGRLIAFHCDQRFVGGRIGGVPVLSDETDRQARIRRRVEELAADGIDAELHVEASHLAASRAIVAAARELGAEAIVCGTRGLDGLQGALLGSVSRELLRLSPVPVIVVPAHAPAAA